MNRQDPISPHHDAAALREELDRYRFVARLDESLWNLVDPDEITYTAARILGQYLGADRCAYAHVDDESDTFTLTGNYAAGLPSIVGRYPMRAFGAEFVRLNRGGLPYVVEDADGDPRCGDVLASYHDAGIRAVVSVPIIKDGRMVAGMALHQARPRRWQAHEIELLAAVANRCWESIERGRMAAQLVRMEEQMRANHDYLRLLLNCTEEGFYSVDRNGMTIMCNTAFLDMLGFAREEDVIGRTLHDVIHHSHPGGAHYHVGDCPIYRAAQDGTPAVVDDEYFFRLDGSAFPVEYRARPVWRDGQLQGAVCTFVDVTERRRTEQALAKSEAHLRSLFEQTGAGICETDLEGRILRVNERFCRIAGRAPRDLVGRPMQELTHPDDIAHNMALWAGALDAGRPFEIEKRYLRPDGATVWVNNTVSPIRAIADGPVETMLAVSVDVSQRKEAQEALQDASRRKDEFLAMLAHELRNPMAPIRTAAELLERGHLDADRLRRTSQVISRQVRHMTGLVDDLLDVSRVTRGLVTLEQGIVDVRQVVADALEQVRPLLEARRHRLALELAPGPAHVLGDHKRLVQVLSNLLNNAAKYTAAGGNVRLALSGAGSSVVLQVADDGVGIPAALQPRVFDLFAQAERSADRSQGGLGIGLALVRSLVELHGGTVACRSDGPRMGSTFTVTLPRAGAAPGPAAAPDGRPAHRAPVTGGGRTVLVVDDNADAAHMLGMYLELAGHRVTVETGSETALRRALASAPHACILDIGLPGMDGHALARALRAAPATAGCLLIALTGYGQEHDRRRALDAGFDHHLVKPVDMAALLPLLAAS